MALPLADTNDTASDNENVYINESGSEYDFDGDQECDSDDGFTMEPTSKPYAETAKTVEQAKRMARTNIMTVSYQNSNMIAKERH